MSGLKNMIREKGQIMKILFVDDDVSIRKQFEDIIGYFGHTIICSTSGKDALKKLNEDIFHLVFTDIKMPEMDGIEFLENIKESGYLNKLDVIIITGHGDKETAIRALRLGAYDFLDKPVGIKELSAVIERVAEHRSLIEENRSLSNNFEKEVNKAAKHIKTRLSETQKRLSEIEGDINFIAGSPVMKKIREEINLYFSDPSIPVLIEGETGTGKEVIAKLIHYGNRKTGKPFVDLNCSAISSELFESELFGYVSGAFTSAKKEGSIGKIELADIGTLFLDEIGDMPLHLQPKLLRVIQERSYYQVGGVKKKECRARIVAATNRNLETLIKTGEFRSDLYHRLNLGYIRIPPLKERKEDIKLLAQYFLQRASAKRRKQFINISSSTLEIFFNYHWPGNVRELENVIERAVILNDNKILKPEHIHFLINTDPSTSSTDTLSVDKDALVVCPGTIQLPEKSIDINNTVTRLANSVLEKFKGNKTKAAQYLHLSRNAFNRRLDNKN